MSINKHDRPFYITVRDPRTKKSKTVTVRGEKLTTTKILKLTVDALYAKRKVG